MLVHQLPGEPKKEPTAPQELPPIPLPFQKKSRKKQIATAFILLLVLVAIVGVVLPRLAPAEKAEFALPAPTPPAAAPALITPADFAMDVSPSFIAVSRGTSKISTIGVAGIPAFDKPVEIIAGSLSGVLVTLAPTAGTPDFASVINVSVLPGASSGFYNISIVGIGDGKTRYARLKILVPQEAALVCGNNVREGTENCDGADVGNRICTSVLGSGYTGTLACKADCTGLDTTGCRQTAVTIGGGVGAPPAPAQQPPAYPQQVSSSLGNATSDLSSALTGLNDIEKILG